MLYGQGFELSRGILMKVTIVERLIRLNVRRALLYQKVIMTSL